MEKTQYEPPKILYRYDSEVRGLTVPTFMTLAEQQFALMIIERMIEFFLRDAEREWSIPISFVTTEWHRFGSKYGSYMLDIKVITEDCDEVCLLSFLGEDSEADLMEDEWVLRELEPECIQDEAFAKEVEEMREIARSTLLIYKDLPYDDAKQ